MVVVARDRIVSSNQTAVDAGIHPGMKTGSAWALAPDLTVCERDTVAEQQALRDLACWSGRLTPHVSIEQPDTLMLEIAGCLRLFRGLEPLLGIAQSEARDLGFEPSIGLAPTPRAALWRARAAVTDPWMDASSMTDAIADLPVTVLGLERNQAAAIQAWGVRSVGELSRLPRDGLTSRLGKGFALVLAQALGELSDPRETFVFPEKFAERIEWPSPIEHTTAMLFSARRMIAALVGWLSRRASGLRECGLVLEHSHAPETLLKLRFAEAVHQPSRIERVLHEQLDRHQLVEPVNAMRLVVSRIEALTGEELGLFADAPPKASVAEVVERMRARVGDALVQTLVAKADYRPEDASGVGYGISAPPPNFPRPIWLLSQPRHLHEIDGRPHHGGPLVLVSGPERIESGWWDEGEDEAAGDVRRDYFSARSPSGQWLWIYRDAEGWWHHGLFG
jgi:protein ImuB